VDGRGKLHPGLAPQNQNADQLAQAPVALVSALRETSVLFAVLLGAVLLKEPLRPIRLIACAVITAGVVLMKLA
jgi:drug/metabolite transporter (DMT)-like permease